LQLTKKLKEKIGRKVSGFTKWNFETSSAEKIGRSFPEAGGKA